MAHNLKNGIPYSDNAVDAVYHSHVFEHIPQDGAKLFLKEIYSVLKPGGIHRIFVPDMETLCEELLNHIALCDANAEDSKNHDNYIDNIIRQWLQEQSVGTLKQGKAQQIIEKIILGSSRKRGQIHLRMYDRINLKLFLEEAGFKSIQPKEYNQSAINSWNDYGIDLNSDGTQYKRHSLYLEAKKPINKG